MGRGLIIVLVAALGFATAAHGQTTAPPGRFAGWTSAIIAADSANTALSSATLSVSPGVSGSQENPMAVWVPADSYVEQSTDSVMRISSTRSQAPESTMPTTLVMPG